MERASDACSPVGPVAVDGRNTAHPVMDAPTASRRRVGFIRPTCAPLTRMAMRNKERGSANFADPLCLTTAVTRARCQCSLGLFNVSTCGSGKHIWLPLSGPYAWFHGVSVPAAGDTVRL